MCCLLNAVWAQHHAQTALLAKNWVMPAQDRAAVASYVTHEYWRMGSDTILDELSWGAEQSNLLTQHSLNEHYRPTTGISHSKGRQPTLATSGNNRHYTHNRHNMRQAVICR